MQLGSTAFDQLRSELAQVRAQLAASERSHRELSQHVFELLLLARRSAERESRLTSKVRELEQLQARHHERLARLERKLAQRTAADGRAGYELELRDRERQQSGKTLLARSDDLTKLRGVSPQFAQALQAAGVKSYAQIAAWTDADIEALASQLKVPASRIRADGWVASARRLSAS